MKNNSINEIWEKIENSKSVLMSLHFGPDGDSLASCVAMKYVLDKMDKKVKIVSRDYLDQTLMELNYSKEVEFGKSISNFDLKDFDLVIFLDSGSASMFGGIPKDKFVINVDHHATNDFYGNLNYVDSSRPSACSVLLDILRDRKIEIDGELATRILLGIYTDSGYFSHDNGNSIKDAAYLIDCGAKYREEIVAKVKYNVPLRLKKYFGLLYERFKITEIKNLKIGHSYSILEDAEKLKMNLSEIRGGVNDLQEIGGLDIVFTLSETPETIKGSFRTRKNIDVSKLAQQLNGGGHKAAAAFNLPKMPIEEAKKVVFDVISKSVN